MFCPGCGLQLKQVEKFCEVCGRDLQSLQQQVEPGTSLLGSDIAVSWRGGQVALGIGLVGVAFLLISGATVALERVGGGLEWGAWLGSHAIGIVILITVWLLGQFRGPLSLRDLGFRQPKVSWVTALLMAGMALGLSLAFTALYAWLIKGLGIGLLVPPEVPKEVIFSGYAAIWTFEALAVWTPLTEETFFRGFVMAGLIPRYGVVGSIVGSALIFSVFHLHPGVLLPIFVAGVLLAVLYHVTGSIWPPVLAHAGQNAIALVAITLQG